MKTVIAVQISKFTLCTDFMARETRLPDEKIAIAAIFSKLTVALLGTFFRIFGFFESDEEFNFEDSGGLRHRVQLYSAGSYAADAERSSISALRSPN